MLGRAGETGAGGLAAPRRAARDRRDRAGDARQRPRPVAGAAPVDPRRARAREHDRVVSVDRREADRRRQSRTSAPERRCRSTARSAIHVYRVLQEALNNVARHSGADQRVGAACDFDAGVLELEVEDHGSGLGPDSRAARPRRRRDARAGGAGRRNDRVPAAARRRHTGAADGAVGARAGEARL